MRMTLKRRPSAQSTPGELFLDGVFECYTLENPAHGAKPHKAIPAGRYAVDITYSPRFARPLPEVLGVPGFVGIRIHPGNAVADTEGCILVGRTRATDWVGESAVAFDVLLVKLRLARARGSITLEIEDAEEDGRGHEEEEERREEARRDEEGSGEGQRQAGGAAGVAHGSREDEGEGRGQGEVSVASGQGLGA